LINLCKERRERNWAAIEPVGEVGLLFFAEDGSDKLFRIVGTFLPDGTAFHLR
jgi:hypothetical protein